MRGAKPNPLAFVLSIRNPDQTSADSSLLQPRTPQNDDQTSSSLRLSRPQPLNTSGMTNAQLRAEIQKYGENPPSRWTKTELQLRLEELSGTNAFVAAPKAKAEKSQYQQLVQDLNTANRRKDSLMEFCQNSLKLNVNKNMTMNQMRRDAMMAIYHRSQPDPTDVVGFGKHASLTYEEVKVHHKEYAKWVITTAHEETDTDPRLQRLAGWLENNPARVGQAMTTLTQRAEASQHQKQPAMETKTKNAKTKASSEGYASSEGSVNSQKIDQLANMMEQVREELSELKKEKDPRRRKTTTETESQPSELSYAMVTEHEKGKGRMSRGA